MTEQENPYAPPRAEVYHEPAPEKDLWSGIGRMMARFFWATAVSLVLFLVVVIAVLPRHNLGFGIIGAMLFAMFTGMIAACIPVKNKAGYIIPAMLVSMTVAYLAGRDAEKAAPHDPPALERN